MGISVLPGQDVSHFGDSKHKKRGFGNAANMQEVSGLLLRLRGSFHLRFGPDVIRGRRTILAKGRCSYAQRKPTSPITSLTDSLQQLNP
jgi:hypothetical protein